MRIASGSGRVTTVQSAGAFIAEMGDSRGGAAGEVACAEGARGQDGAAEVEDAVAAKAETGAVPLRRGEDGGADGGVGGAADGVALAGSGAMGGGRWPEMLYGLPRDVQAAAQTQRG